MGAIRFDYNQAGWGSSKFYPDGALKPWKLDKIVIHYGGSTNPGDSIDHEMAVLRGWQNYHISSKGWYDIAYCFGFGNSGAVYRLRGFNRNGATSGDYDHDGIPENSEALSLVWVGGQPHEPSAEAYASMGSAIREVFAQYGVVPVTVHSDHKATSCPGDFWRAWRDREGWRDDATEPPVEPPIEEEFHMQTIRLYDGFVSKGKEAMRPTVKAWQAILAHHKFADPSTVDGTCAIDGMYGTGSESSTRRLQAALGVPVDGVVGPVTWTVGVA